MQSALTVITKIRPEKAADLEILLDKIGGDIRGKDENTYLRLGEIDSLQFGRFVLIPNKSTGNMEYLLFTSNYDGTLQAHLNEFIDKFGETVDLIWGSCEGYPAGREHDPNRFKQLFRTWIEHHSHDYAAFYIGFHNELVKNKRAYIRFHEVIDEYFDLPQVKAVANERLAKIKGHSPIQALQAFFDIPEARAYYDNKIRPMFSELPPIHPGPPKPHLMSAVKLVLHFIWMLIDVFIRQPIRDRQRPRNLELNLDLDDLQVQEGVAAIEDVVTQNQLTVISKIRPGWFVLVKLKIVLILIHLVGRYFQNQGALGGIATIHFARWAIIDKGRWLLFTSNYDGSWDSYIGDFVDKAASGMDLIWTSAPRYPKQGSRDIEAFKAIIRVNQVRTQVFYSGFPNRTVVNLINDGRLANELYRQGISEWLRRL